MGWCPFSSDSSWSPRLSFLVFPPLVLHGPALLHGFFTASETERRGPPCVGKVSEDVGKTLILQLFSQRGPVKAPQ